MRTSVASTLKPTCKFRLQACVIANVTTQGSRARQQKLLVGFQT